MNYRPEIDGLRAIAVLVVIAFHAKLDSFAGGFIGVDVFFVISGYLISTLIFLDLERNRFSIVEFYERRARRIMPALIVVAAISIIPAVVLMFPYQLVDFSESVIATFTFTSNILFWWESGYFGEFESKKPLLHTWTLSVEEHFYIIFPVLCFIFWKHSKALLGAIVLLLCLFSFVLSEWASTRYGGANFFLTPTRVWELGIGVCVAAYLRSSAIRPVGAISELLSLCGLGLILVALLLFDETTPFPGKWALLPTLGTALVIVCAGRESLVGKVLAYRPLVQIGLISYSAYLWHQPVFAFTTIGYPDLMRGWSLVIPFTVVGILSSLSWQYVEKPFRNRGRFTRRQIFSYSGLGMAALIAIGALGVALKGLPQRFAESDRSIVTLKIGELGRFNAKAFYEIEGREFDGSASKLKILIVGDSHARDFLNVLNHFDSSSNFDISAHGIPRPCGIALAEPASRKVAKAHQLRCAKVDRFESAELQRRVREADYVILVQSWLPWVVRELPGMLTHLEKIGAPEVIVVGRKNFGVITPYQYLGLSLEDKTAVRLPTTDDQQQVNQLMMQVLGEDKFFNFAREVCLSETDCAIFTKSSGELISYDGGHLTPDGARYMASVIQELSPFRELVEQAASP